MNIIGINCSHDASVCLISDNKISCAITEERISRIKYQEGIPYNAIKLVLDKIEPNTDIDAVVISQIPPSINDKLIFSNFNKLDSALLKLINPSHHLLHAFSAFSITKERPAACLVVDGSGYSFAEYQRRDAELLGETPPHVDAEEAWSIFYIDENDKISVVARDWRLWDDAHNGYFAFPSLGHMYSMGAQYVFGHWEAAGKLMGLSAYGDKNNVDFDILSIKQNKLNIDTSWVFKLPHRNTNNEIYQTNLAKDLAAKIQSELEKGMLYLAKLAHDRTKAPTLCITGGVALNALANQKIILSNIFKNVVITPAAQDSGIAIGAASYGFYKLNNIVPDFSATPEFYGPQYSNAEILSTLERSKDIVYEVIDQKEVHETIADSIISGKIVAIFDGESEFGPRALGHRSIIADPRNKEIKSYLNRHIKFREDFRPYAVSVLEEETLKWFNGIKQSRHMLITANVKNSKKAIIDNLIHHDNTCRLQTLPKHESNNFRKIIESFYAKTGVPMVLNTSFNVAGEPIVETPLDAINTLMKSKIDELYITNYKILKK